MRFNRLVLTLLSAAVASAALTGCGVTVNDIPSLLTGLPIKGTVHGGQQPVVGARVYLLAASTAGNGSASASLLSSGLSGTDSVGGYVLTGPGGVFSVGGDYSCTSGQQVYLLALGGDPTGGTSGTINNSAISLMTALGNCPSSGTLAARYPSVTINELTTVAASYALSGYMTDATHIASSGSAQALTGIANAFLTASNLVDPVAGGALALTPAGSGLPPAAEINTLGNILGTCINTNSSSSSNCSALMGAALSGGSTGSTPADTATAMVNIAHHPGSATQTLFGLVTGAGAPFQPSLATQPNDFSVGIVWPINSKQVAFDSAGNLWTVNSGLLEYSNSGSILSPATGFTGAGVAASTGIPNALAIDPQNQVWLTTFVQSTGMANNFLSEFSSTGSPMSASGLTGAGLNQPVTLAIDGAGNVFAGNSTSSISKFSNAGSPAIGSPFVNAQPYSLNLAVDNSGNLWSSSVSYGSSAATTSLIELDNSGNMLRSPVASSSNQYSNLSVDSSNDVWGTINFLNGQPVTPQIFKLTAAGTAAPGLPVTGNTALQNCLQTQIDGDGNLWCASDNSVAEASSTGASLSPNNGYVVPNAFSPLNLAIDSSGNVWTTGGYNASIARVAVELVGAAAPVVTPLSLAVQLNKLGSRP